MKARISQAQAKKQDDKELFDTEIEKSPEDSPNNKSKASLNIPGPTPPQQYPTVDANVSELNYLVQSEVNIEKVRELLSKNLVDMSTALTIAMNNNCYEMSKLLLEFGASTEQVRQISKDWFFSGWKSIADNEQINREKRLRDAAFKGNLDEVKRMLSWGVSPNTTNVTTGNTPLFLAAGVGATDVVQVLLEANAKVNLGNIDGATPLIIASAKGQTAAVQLLLANQATDVNAFYHEAQNALGVAANVEILNLMLADPRIDVNAFDAYRHRTALMNIVLREDRTLLIALLKARGLKINLKNNYGNTACMLINNKKDKFFNPEFSALLAEAETRDFQLFTIFERHDQYFAQDIKGLNLQGKNDQGENALLSAIRRGNIDLVVWLLQEGGMSLEAENNHGILPMEHAIAHGKIEVVRALHQTFKIDINKKYGKNALTAILLAAQHDEPDLVLALQKMGANLDYQDDRGQTALHWMAAKGRQPIVEALLEGGACADLIEANGKTAMDVAANAMVKQALLYHQFKRCRYFPAENLATYFEKTWPPACPPLWSYVVSLSRTAPDTTKAANVLEEALPKEGEAAQQNTLLRAYMQQFGFKHSIQNELEDIRINKSKNQ